MSVVTYATIGDQKYQLISGKGLVSYLAFCASTGQIDPEKGFTKWGLAICDVLDIVTEGTHPGMNWGAEFENTDDIRWEQMVQAVRQAIDNIPTESWVICGQEEEQPEEEQPLTTDFSAPGMPAVGTPEWHAMVKGGMAR